MKKILTTLGFSLFFCLGMQAQDLKIKVTEKGKVGFVDKSGNEVVPCKYTSAAPFEWGVSVVSKGEKYGLVNTQGVEVVKPQYDQIQPWGKELFMVKKGKKYGILSPDGAMKLEAKYTHLSRPNQYGKAWVAMGGKVKPINGKSYFMGGKYGIVNSDGSIAVPAIYKGLFEFNLSSTNSPAMYEGMRPGYRMRQTSDTLETNGKYYAFTKAENTTMYAGIVSSTGEELMPMNKATWIMYPQSGMVRCYKTSKKSTECLYYNLESGQTMTVYSYKNNIDDLEHWTHSDFNGQIAAVNTTEGWKFIDKEGNEKQSGFTRIEHSENYKAWAGVKADSKECYVYDEDGNPFFSTDIKIEGIQFTTNSGHTDIVGVLKDGKWGAINRKGETIIPFDYDNVLSPWFNYIAVKTTDGWGLRDLQNNELIPCQFTNLLTTSEENPQIVWTQKADSLWYAYELAKKTVRPIGYENVTNYKDGYAWVRTKDLLIEDNQVMRGMITNNCTEEVFNKSLNLYGSVLGTNGEVYAEGPYYIGVMPKLISLMHAFGDKKLTKSQDKKMRLYITREARSYPINKIDNEDWDY